MTFRTAYYCLNCEHSCLQMIRLLCSFLLLHLSTDSHGFGFSASARARAGSGQGVLFRWGSSAAHFCACSASIPLSHPHNDPVIPTLQMRRLRFQEVKGHSC